MQGELADGEASFQRRLNEAYETQLLSALEVEKEMMAASRHFGSVYGSRDEYKHAKLKINLLEKIEVFIDKKRDTTSGGLTSDELVELDRLKTKYQHDDLS